MSIGLAATGIQRIVDNIISQPLTPQGERILNDYVRNVIVKQPANLQAAHNDFLAALRKDNAIPQNVRGAMELRLNRVYFLFNQLKNNRAAFDAALRANDNNISTFAGTEQYQQLQQQYRQFAGRLQSITTEGAYGELLTYATPAPIYSVPPR